MDIFATRAVIKCPEKAAVKVVRRGLTIRVSHYPVARSTSARSGAIGIEEKLQGGADKLAVAPAIS